VLFRSLTVNFNDDCLECTINAKLSWLPPAYHNGIINGYWVRYSGRNNETDQTLGTKSVKIDAKKAAKLSEAFYELTELEGGATYQVSIQAVNQAGIGSISVIKFTAPVHIPISNNITIDLEKVTKTARTINIWIEKSFFSNKNGEVVHFSVIVTEISENNPSNNATESNAVVSSYIENQKNSGLWQPYQTQEKQAWFTRFREQMKSAESASFSYTIGDEKECKSNYCNGPLKADTAYRIKLRAFNDAGFVDTPYSDEIRTEKLPAKDSPIMNILVIVISVLVSLGAVGGIVAVVLLKCRRSLLCMKKANPIGDGYVSKSTSGFSLPLNFNNSMGSSPANNSLSSDSNNLIIMNNVTNKVEVTSKPIKVAQFTEHYKNLSKNSDYLFATEFESLKDVGTKQSQTVADLPINRPKNRFTNILAYDASRVELDAFNTDPTSEFYDGLDYINANFIPANNSKREFIATQGPLAHTKDDFWRMCWDCDVKAIVMLTKCLEGNRERCERYWPTDSLPVMYGSIEVSVLKEHSYSEWNIAEIKLTKSDITKRLWHYHYTQWPDFKVPDNPLSLIQFTRVLRDRVRHGQEPIVVHCSAGVGRTGTFIVLDTLMQQIGTCETIDIYGQVYEMRKHRVQMVQTEAQYICLHQCALKLIEEANIPQAPSISASTNTTSANTTIATTVFENFGFQGY